MADPLIRYTPGITRLSDAIDRLFRESFVLPRFFEPLTDGFTRISSNLLETEDAYIVQIGIPGIDPEKVEVRVVGRQLTVKGKYEFPEVEKATAVRQEVTKGEFSEVFTVATDIDGDKAQAKYERGILTITLPKAEHVKAKAIKVQVAK
jgi:HSP20 family protein